MKRLINHHLFQWKNSSSRKPLLLRGARQVGKTYAIRELGKSFEYFVEINLEFNQNARKIIEQDLDPKRIIFQLSELLQVVITPGKTLLFFDEVQILPQTVTLLRYFYELIPDLHVVAAGSLLDFAIEQVGMPVGRVSSLYMYPLSFLEFMVATENKTWAKKVLENNISEQITEPLHNKLLNLVGEYIAIGGMPEAVNRWIKFKTSREVKIVHSDLLFNYQQDFEKYAKRNQLKYLSILFQKSIEQLGNKFVYSRVGEYQKRELEPALELLIKAGIFYKTIQSSAQGIPLGAQADLNDFKLTFLDVGLTQAILKWDISTWFIDAKTEFINKGKIIESFVGQEILVYSDPIIKETLFYWHRENRSSQAEVDFVIQLKDKIVPIEVKAGVSSRLKSMQIFLETHPNSNYGIRFSAKNYELNNNIFSYPLYAVIKPLLESNQDLSAAAQNLLK